MFWIMKGHEIIPVSREEYFKVMDEAQKSDKAWAERFRVAKTDLPRVTVYTSFLGINHNFGNDDDPILFETMVSHRDTGQFLDFQERYRTRREAEEGHDRVVTLCLNDPNDIPLEEE